VKPNAESQMKTQLNTTITMNVPPGQACRIHQVLLLTNVEHRWVAEWQEESEEFGERATTLSSCTSLTRTALELETGLHSVITTYEGASKSFRTESITKYTLTTINTR
jgi:hypothetical protein